MMYIRSQRIHRKLLELVSNFSQVAGHKINTRNQLYFYTYVMNSLNIKLRKQSHLQ